MIRINKYQESIKKFIKNEILIGNDLVKNYFTNILEHDDLLPCILVLTLINHLTVDQKYCSILGYNLASLFFLLINAQDLEDRIESWDEMLEIWKEMNNLILNQLMESIHLLITYNYSETKNILGIVKGKKIEYQDFPEVCEMICTCLRVTNTNIPLNDFRNIGYQFSQLYSIYKNFVNLKNDKIKSIKNQKIDNIILISGIQKSYEKYLFHKQNFINDLIKNKLYTETIKEIINYLDEKIDSNLENENPGVTSISTV